MLSSRSHEAAEQGDEADEAGASDGASQLIPGVGPTNGGRVRWIAATAVTFTLLGCSSEEPWPSPKPTRRPAFFEPAQICVELPVPPPLAASRGADAQDCVPSRYTKGLPLEITITRDRVTAFRFYEQCEGRVHEVEPRVRECIKAVLATWRFEHTPPTCPETNRLDYDQETIQLHILPRGRPVPRQQLATGVGFGCAGV